MDKLLLSSFNGRYWRNTQISVKFSISFDLVLNQKLLDVLMENTRFALEMSLPAMSVRMKATVYEWPAADLCEQNTF